MTYIPVLKSQQKLAENIAQLQDPSLSSNWVLIKKYSLNNEILDDTIDGLSRKDKLMVRSKILGSNSRVIFRPNNDSILSSYQYSFHSSGTSHIANDNVLSEAGILCGVNRSVSECYINLNNELDFIFAHLKCSQFTASWRGTLEYGSTWKNTTNEVTFAKIITTNITSGEVEVYKWQDIKPVELHSYELVKEYNLNDQILNESIDWDGEIDDRCIVDINVNTLNVLNMITLKINNIGDIYSLAGIGQDGPNVTGIAYTTGNITTPFFQNGHVAGSFDLYLKSGTNRSIFGGPWTRKYSANSDSILTQQVFIWNDIITPVTSIQLETDGQISGTIRVYKLVKSHLVCQTPGLIQGIWQKSIDNDTIEINPGSLEIAGVICNQTSKKQITLSGNLRTGETELSNTYYYLYAIQGAGRTLSYKFSSIAPLMDRFSNIISSFDDCDSNQSWHHPNEGIAWRYIGQVYNDESSNIIQFDKCYPGYWESSWTNVSGTSYVLAHSYGKFPKIKNVFINTVASFTNAKTCNGRFYNGTAHYGLTYDWNLPDSSTITTIAFSLGSGGIFYSGGSWKTSGYIKVIVEE